jgi:RNA polymerase sigma factor (sigma-70 family)
MDRDSASTEVEKLFDKWYPYLVRYGRRLCREQAVVEDCVQQVMLLFFRELRNGADIPNPKAWTLLVLRREILRFLRRERNHVVLEDHLASALAAEDHPGVPVELDSIDSFLSLLSPREAEVLLLRMNGLKYREIATTLRIGGNSVNRFLARAITKIRAWRNVAEADRGRIGTREPQPQQHRQVKR